MNGRYSQHFRKAQTNTVTMETRCCKVLFPNYFLKNRLKILLGGFPRSRQWGGGRKAYYVTPNMSYDYVVGKREKKGEYVIHV